MSLGTDVKGADGKTPLWKMMDRAAWKEQTYYTLQRCPTTTHTHRHRTHTPSTRTHTHTHTYTHTHLHSHAHTHTHTHTLTWTNRQSPAYLPASTCAWATCATFYFTLLRSLLTFISLNYIIFHRYTLTPSAQKNELGQPSSWTHGRRQLSQKNIDFTSVNPKVSAQKVHKKQHYIT